MAGYLKEVLDKGLESGTASYLGISPEDIDWASSIGSKYKLAPGNTDAARHVALGWLASKSKNPEAAKFLADLREYSPLAGGIPSRRMDLENNAIGFSLPAESKETAEQLILKLIDSQQVNVDDPQNYAEGGEVAEEKTYEYGFGPEASGIGQLVSPFMPFRREVEQPYREEFTESVDPTQMDRVVTPGQYGDVEPAVPEALQGLASFKGLLRDPEARQAVMDALASTPDALQGLARRMGISGEAALAGEQQVYDPKTGQVVGAEEVMLAAPTMIAPGTAASIARTAGEGGTVLGIMAGKSAKGFGNIKRRVDKLRERGLEGQELWDAQSNQSARGFVDPVDGELKIELDTSKARLHKRKNEADPLGPPSYGPSRDSYKEQEKLPDILDFPSLFSAYPQLSQITVKRVPLMSMLGGTKGAYDPKTKTLLVTSTTKDPDDLLSTVLHEVQHAVQAEEQGLRGGSPSMFRSTDYDEQYADITKSKKTFEKDITEFLKDKKGVELRSFSNTPEKLIDVLQLTPEQRQGLALIKQYDEVKPGDYRTRIALREKLEELYGKDSYNKRYDLRQVIDDFNGDIETLLSSAEELRPVLNLYKDTVSDYLKLVSEGNRATQQYNRIPGEVEARNVQSRFEKPEIKAQIPPATAEFTAEEMVYPIDPSYRRPPLKIGQQGPEPEGMANGGGVAALAPRAKGMFNTPHIRRGVGSFAPYTTRRA